jgi:hypothetical protein
MLGGVILPFALSYALRLFPVNGTEGIVMNQCYYDTNKGGTTAFSSLAEEGFFYFQKKGFDYNG